MPNFKKFVVARKNILAVIGKDFHRASVDKYIEGYITSMSFTFGHKAKTSIKMIQIDAIDGVTITIERYYGENLLQTNTYFLPLGYLYNIENPYIDKRLNGHRYIFMPENDSATGAVSEGLIDVENYDVAIDFYDRIAHLVSVDSISMSGEVVSIT